MWISPRVRGRCGARASSQCKAFDMVPIEALPLGVKHRSALLRSSRAERPRPHPEESQHGGALRFPPFSCARAGLRGDVIEARRYVLRHVVACWRHTQRLYRCEAGAAWGEGEGRGLREGRVGPGRANQPFSSLRLPFIAWAAWGSAIAESMSFLVSKPERIRVSVKRRPAPLSR